MPWNGAGTYNLPPAYSPEVNGTIVDATRYNGLTTDVATGISNAVAKDGQNVPTANLPMGGFKHTGVADAVAAGQYLAYNQATAASLSSLTLTGNLIVAGNTTLGDAVGDTFTISSNAVTWSGNPTHSGNHTFSGNVLHNGATTLGDAAGDALTINSSAVSTPNGLNFDSNTFVIDATNNRVGVNVAAPATSLDVSGSVTVRGGGGTGYIDFLGAGVASPPGAMTYGLFPQSGVGLGVTSGTAIGFWTASAERLRIGSTGDFALGAHNTQSFASPGIRLANLYSVLGNFSGTVSAAGTITSSFAGTGYSQSSSSASGNAIVIQNTNATASATSVIQMVTAAGGGDIFNSYVVTAGQVWSVGVDVSDSSAFVFSSGSSLGVSNTLRVSTAGAVTIPGTLGVTGVLTASGGVAGNVTGNLTGNASTATALATGRTIAITGDLGYTSPSFDGTGNVTAAGTLATVNANVGSFGSSTAIPAFTVNAKGLITAASSSAVIAPAGTLTGATLAAGVTASSLTSVGTLTSLTASGTSALTNLTVSGTSAHTGNATFNGNVTLGDAAADVITLTGTPAGQVVATTYTPTVSASINVAATTLRAAWYSRVGENVEVNVLVEIDPTAAGGASTQVTLTLPVASSFTTIYQACGVGTESTGGPQTGLVQSINATSTVSYTFAAFSVANLLHAIKFGYRIV